MRTRLTVALSACLLTGATLLATPPASATDYPVSAFDVTYGQTYTRGTITWYGRSVVVSGEDKSVDVNSCRGTTAFTLDAGNAQMGVGESDAVCGASDFIYFSVPADAPGGAAVVRVCLDNGGTEGNVVYLKCVRYGHP
ncbi:hypothetical protein ACFVEN_44175 [Streptomyces sp. NPDC057681]|uniref:hypothetical protein n=1 Tax=Streptomyces sp. NPDC057681 TaxID=3346209 RepID=UPI0036A4633F